MNAILGMIDLTLHGHLDEDQRDNLSTARDSAKHLLQIINDILDLSKIEAGKIELERTDFDLKSLSRSVLSTFDMQARKKGLRLDLDLDPEVPGYLKGDPIRLRQVLVNLIGNAVKFTDHGGVSVEIRRADREEGGRVPLRFAVRDTGIGIPDDQKDTIFATFSQAEAGITKKYGGTGLGLAICKQLVEMMGGRIWVEGEAVRGSAFHFTLELEKGDQERSRPGIGESPAAKSERPLMVLLAEDNPINAKVATKFLERLGHRTVVAANGRKVLAALSKEKFDVVLMDVEMPEMSGLEAAARIRAGEAGPDNRRMPIIAMTAHALTEFREKSEEVGMNDYLTKPVDFARLGEIIQRNLGPRQDIFAQEQSSRPNASAEVELDLEAALQRIGGDEDLLMELFGVFLKDAPGKLARLKEALREGRLKEVEQLAHSFKNTCGTLGAQICFQISGRLEAAARKERRDEVAPLAADLLNQLDRLVAVLEARLSAKGA